jgi:hypothetical protein
VNIIDVISAVLRLTQGNMFGAILKDVPNRDSVMFFLLFTFHRLAFENSSWTRPQTFLGQVSIFSSNAPSIGN